MVPVAVRSEIVLEVLVLALCLAVCLRVVRRAESARRIQQPAEGGPEVAGEEGIPVTDDAVWEAEWAEDVVKEELGEAWAGQRLRSRNVQRVLGEAVHDDENGVVVSPCDRVLARWEAGDEVKRDLLKGATWRRQAGEEAVRGMTPGLRSLATVAVLDVGIDVGRESRPVI